jgi:hypothetical protein
VSFLCLLDVVCICQVECCFKKARDLVPLVCCCMLRWHGKLSKKFFGGTGVWTQDFELAKQALYHLSHTSCCFCSGCFYGDGVFWTICFGWPQISILSVSASQIATITGVSHRHLPISVYISISISISLSIYLSIDLRIIYLAVIGNEPRQTVHHLRYTPRSSLIGSHAHFVWGSLKLVILLPPPPVCLGL